MRILPRRPVMPSAVGASLATLLLVSASPTASAVVGTELEATATQATATSATSTASTSAAYAAYAFTAADLRMRTALTSRATTARFGSLLHRRRRGCHLEHRGLAQER